jgi:hypothetical protein
MRLVALLLLLSLFCTAGQAQEWDPDKFKTRGAVALFWEACVHQYPDRDKFEFWLRTARFKEFTPAAAEGLVNEPGGRAWAIDNIGARYLLVAEASNLCTVYMKAYDPSILTASMETGQRNLAASRWLEFDNVERTTSEKGDLKFTTDQYKNHGEVVLNIIVSEVRPGTSFFELSMTATMKRLANQPQQPTAPKDGASVER